MEYSDIYFHLMEFYWKRVANASGAEGYAVYHPFNNYQQLFWTDAIWIEFSKDDNWSVIDRQIVIAVDSAVWRQWERIASFPRQGVLPKLLKLFRSRPDLEPLDSHELIDLNLSLFDTPRTTKE